MPDDKKNDFADSGEFSGMGVPAADPVEEPNTEGAPADSGTGADGANAETETRNTETGTADKTQEETKTETKEQETPEAPDPLDEVITDFGNVDLGLGDAPVDKSVMEAFGKQCVALKLTPRQAAGLAQFQLQAIEEARQRLTDESCKTLAREWGKEANANQQAIVNLVNRVDEALGNNDFSTALNASGVTCYAEFAKGLLALVKMTGEDSLGPTANGQNPGHPETALEGLHDAFAKARGK